MPLDRTVQPNGEKIKALRLALKWSQEDLAREAVCSKRTVENAEAGKRVKESGLIDIAARLGVAVSELVCEKEDALSDAPVPAETGFRVRAQCRELHALDDYGRVGELTRRCYYKIENATLTIRKTEAGDMADLIIDNMTMYDDPSCSKECERSSHRLQGHGPVVDGSVYILYTVEDQTRRQSWAGVCVLNAPRTGKIHGYWMTAGHAERGRTVLGTLELELNLI